MAFPDLLPDGTWEMPETEGPCTTWPLAAGCHKFPEDVEEWTELHVWSVELATDLLWRLTAGRFGLCPETVRPCRRRCEPGFGIAGWRPELDHGRWVNITCSCPRDDLCACEGVSQVRVPGPVYVDEDHPITVTIDGEELAGGEFEFYEPNRLIRLGGLKWPNCQKLATPLTEPGTWAITYSRGIPVPVGGKMAVATYAYELWKACTGTAGCKLPERVQTISRQGVTYTMIDPRDFLDAGRTGITMVDQWLAAVNPKGQLTPSSVTSPDAARFRQGRR